MSQRYNPSHVQPVVTYADVRRIFDTHGVTPATKKAPDRLLARAYRAWVKAEGLDTSRRYVMPMHLLPGHVRQHLRATEGRRVNDAELRAALVNELNDPACGLVIAPRPFHVKRAA